MLGPCTVQEDELYRLKGAYEAARVQADDTRATSELGAAGLGGIPRMPIRERIGVGEVRLGEWEGRRSRQKPHCRRTSFGMFHPPRDSST